MKRTLSIKIVVLTVVLKVVLTVLKVVLTVLKVVLTVRAPSNLWHTVGSGCPRVEMPGEIQSPNTHR